MTNVTVTVTLKPCGSCGKGVQGFNLTNGEYFYEKTCTRCLKKGNMQQLPIQICGLSKDQQENVDLRNEIERLRKENAAHIKKIDEQTELLRLANNEIGRLEKSIEYARIESASTSHVPSPQISPYSQGSNVPRSRASPKNPYSGY